MAAFLGYTDAGSAFVYGQLVNGAYLNSQAIREYPWNETVIKPAEVEKLASIADGLVDGTSSVFYMCIYCYLIKFLNFSLVNISLLNF